MKHILIVDDNAVTVSMLSKVLMAHGNIFDISTAKDGKDAIGVIDSKKIDLVITDLSMPRMNGFALIEYILKSYPDTHIIAMSAYGTPEIEAKFNSMPTIKYFNKPLKTDVIIDTIFAKLEISYGQIEGIGLSSFLQLLEMESKTCTLSIISSQGKKTGALYFLEGALIDAETEGLEGDAAAYEMVSWEDAKIQIVNTLRKQERKIVQPLMNILMEGAKLKDEKEEEAEKEEETEKPLNISEEPADNNSIQETGGVFDEISLPGEPTGGESQQLDEIPELFTVEQLLESSPLSGILSKMKDALVKIMGPIAEIVFTDSLDSWMTSGEPSTSSIPLLLDILDSEIGDPEKITKYREMIE
jgi:CheY-like chemotaxis protein